MRLTSPQSNLDYDRSSDLALMIGCWIQHPAVKRATLKCGKWKEFVEADRMTDDPIIKKSLAEEAGEEEEESK